MPVEVEGRRNLGVVVVDEQGGGAVHQRPELHGDRLRIIFDLVGRAIGRDLAMTKAKHAFPWLATSSSLASEGFCPNISLKRALSSEA